MIIKKELGHRGGKYNLTTSQTEDQCGCQITGLAILPVRYTVVPTYLGRPKPQWANLSSVTKVSLSEGYQYHVRRLREGYLYVYLPAEMGDDKWQVYSINGNGDLFKQPSNSATKTADQINESGEYQCPNLTKNSLHNAFITLPNPQYQQKIFIAYSECIWSDETLQLHQQAPEKRMQLVEPEQWKNQGSSNDSSTVANQSNIEQILDFDPQFERSLLPYDKQDSVTGKLTLVAESKDVDEAKKTAKFNYTDQLSYDQKGLNGDITKAYGFDDKILKKNTTCYPWTEQQSTISSLSQTMTRYSQGYSPILLAIDDPLGIAHELNGYYSEIFAKNEQYRQEREFEFNAKESYEYAMEILAQSEFSRNDFNLSFTEHPYLKKVMETQKIERSSELPIFSNYNQLSVLIYSKYQGHINSLSYVRPMIVNDNFSSNLPLGAWGRDIYNYEKGQFLHGSDLGQYSVNEINGYHACADYRTYNTIDKTNLQINLVNDLEKYANRHLSYFEQNESRFIQEREQKVQDIRKKYAKCLKTENFDKKYQSLLEQIANIAEDRVKQSINWIKQSNFYLHLQDLRENEWTEIICSDEQDIELLNNQEEIDQALADNEITATEAEQLKKVNLYGILYGSFIERSIAGFELTETGKSQLKQWFMFENLEKDDSNAILWQALAHGSQDIVKDIQRFIKSAKSLKSSADIDEVFTMTLTGKLLSYYKKVQGFLNAVENYHEAFANITKIEERLSKIKKIESSFTVKNLKYSPLLKIILGKPNLSINNSLLKLANIMFFIPNHMVQLVNIPVAYLFHLTLCGIPKQSIKFYLSAQKNINQLILTSPVHTKVSLPGGVVGQLTGKAREKILARNAEYLRLEQRKYDVITKRIFKIYKNRVRATIKTDKENFKKIAPERSSGSKDARIAMLIGIFEAYNWYQLKRQQEELGSDEFWTKEMIKSSLALSSIATEIVAQYTKIARGKNSVAFGRTKVLSGIMGMAVSLWVAAERGIGSYEEFKQGNITLSFLQMLSGAGYLTSGVFNLNASITYHIPWLRKVITKQIEATTKASAEAARRVAAKIVSRKIMERAIQQYAKMMANMAFKRVLMLGAGFWLGVALILLDIVISYVKDNELEDWLKHCALGEKYKDSSAYQNIEQQKTEFEKVLESMFGITKEILNSKLSDPVDESTNSDSHQPTAFNEYDALLLISQDLVLQKANREALLEQAKKDKAYAEQYAKDAQYSYPGGVSVQDVFGYWF